MHCCCYIKHVFCSGLNETLLANNIYICLSWLHNVHIALIPCTVLMLLLQLSFTDLTSTLKVINQIIVC